MCGPSKPERQVVDAQHLRRSTHAGRSGSMSRRGALRRGARFRLDTALTRGATPIVGLLGLVTALLITFCALIVVIGGISDANGERQSFFESGWRALMRTLDPGTMGGDQGWSYRFVSLFATLGGIFVVSTLIGLITTAIDGRLSELRAGRGPVELTGHIVILGWSQGIEFVLAELAEANSNQERPTVVVLSHHDAQWMGAQLSTMMRRHGHVRVVYRTGDTSDLDDLALVSTERARSVIVLHDDSSEADAETVRTSLAVINGLPNYSGRVVTQISDRDRAVALAEATAGRVVAVASRDVIAKVTAQVCRFRGMAAVYEDLLDFDGDEIYVQHEPRLIGATFAQVILSYDDSTPIGLQRRDRTIELCPPLNRVVGHDESIVAISRDDDTIVLTEVAEPVSFNEVAGVDVSSGTLHLLVIGWSEIAVDLITILDALLPDGSTITICDPEVDAGLLPNTSHDVTLADASTDTVEGLRSLLGMRKFDNVLLLCERTCSPVEDDSRNLLRLVVLRGVRSESDCPSASVAVVTELRDLADVAIAGDEGDDFLVSDRITSLLLAQLAESPDLLQVFDALFEPSDIDLVMVPATSIVAPGRCLYGDIVRRALPHGLVIGVSEHRGTRLNLHRAEPLMVDDRVHLVLLRRINDE